jgi:hypothetical protein
MTEERRNIARHRTFLQGRVLFNNRRSSVDCIIRELTDEGARLSFNDPVGVPHAFELYIPNRDQTFRAEIAWNHGDEMGVTFASATAGQPTLQPSLTANAGMSIVERVERLEKELAQLKRKLAEAELKNNQ